MVGQKTKKGSSRCDRIPIDVIDEIYFHCPEDYSSFIPSNLPEEFTSADFAKCANIKRNIAQLALNILTYLNVTKKTNAKGRTFYYKLN